MIFNLNLTRKTVVLIYGVFCIAVPLKRGSTDVVTLCSTIIGGVSADCVINNTCSPVKIYSAVAGGFICWVAGRAENFIDFKLQSTQTNKVSTCDCMKGGDGYCYVKD